MSQPYIYIYTRLLCPWDSPDKNTGVGCHFLLQGIFPTQGSNLCLLNWQADSSPLSHQGSPYIHIPPPFWVSFPFRTPDGSVIKTWHIFKHLMVGIRMIFQLVILLWVKGESGSTQGRLVSRTLGYSLCWDQDREHRPRDVAWEGKVPAAATS